MLRQKKTGRGNDRVNPVLKNCKSPSTRHIGFSHTTVARGADQMNGSGGSSSSNSNNGGAKCPFLDFEPRLLSFDDESPQITDVFSLVTVGDIEYFDALLQDQDLYGREATIRDYPYARVVGVTGFGESMFGRNGKVEYLALSIRRVFDKKNELRYRGNESYWKTCDTEAKEEKDDESGGSSSSSEMTSSVEDAPDEIATGMDNEKKEAKEEESERQVITSESDKKSYHAVLTGSSAQLESNGVKSKRKRKKRAVRQMDDLLPGPSPSCVVTVEKEQKENPSSPPSTPPLSLPLQSPEVDKDARSGSPFKQQQQKMIDESLVDPRYGLSAQTLLYHVHPKAEYVVVLIDMQIIRSSSCLERKVTTILTELFKSRATVKLFFNGIGVLDNLVNGEGFEVNGSVDVQRLHNDIVKDPNPRALPSMWIISKKYKAPTSLIRTSFEFHDYGKALNFLDAPLSRMSTRGEKITNISKVSDPTYAKERIGNGSLPSGSMVTKKGKDSNHHRHPQHQQQQQQVDVRKVNWGVFNVLSTTQRDRLCVDTVTMIVLFDYMTAHIEAGADGSDELLRICENCERKLKKTVDAKFHRVLRLNSSQVGEVIGMHGGNVAKIRQNDTSVELYHKNTFVITAHSEAAVEEAVSHVVRTIYPPPRRSVGSDGKQEGKEK